VFYLLVDHSSNPIIVDQPEENVDSLRFIPKCPAFHLVSKSRGVYPNADTSAFCCLPRAQVGQFELEE
jgi:hypothetical protein